VSFDVAGLLQASLMLFIIIDPLGGAPLFHAYTQHMDFASRQRVIVKSVAIASGLLVFFGLVGEPFLRYFGVTLSDFRVAGGVILFIYGVLGILGVGEATYLEKERSEAIAAVPLATPLLAGPGAIATTIYIKYNWGLGVAMASIAVNTAATLAFLLAGEKILSLLGRSLSVLLSRLVAMLLAAIAVGMIRQGVVEVFLLAR